MKKFYSLFLFLVLTSVFTFVSCQKDDGVTPEPGINPDNEAFDPKLSGIWIKTYEGEEGAQNVPVNSDEYTLLVLEPRSRAAIYYETENQNYQECGLFAKSDSIAMIDAEVYNEIESELGKTRSSSSDFDLISKNKDLKDVVTIGTYKLESDNSLVIFYNLNGKRIYSGFSRMTEVEQHIEGTKSILPDWETLRNMVVEAIKNIASKLNPGSVEETNKDWLYGTVEYYNENFDNSNGWTYYNWISCLPDSMLINDIVVPGAHDACTASLNAVAKVTNADCQVLKFDKLLEAGVRFFDLRATVSIQNFTIFGDKTKKIRITHGCFDCEEKLHEVLNTTKKFLENNPGEFVILRVKYENTKISSNENMTTEYCHALLNQDEYKKIIAPYTTDTLKNVRGKILFINALKVNDESQRIGSYIDYKGHDDDESKDCELNVYKNGKFVKKEIIWFQDYYSFDGLVDLKKKHLKEDAIKSYAVDASKMKNTPFFVTQLNASTFTLKSGTINVAKIAKFFNPYTLDLFARNMKDDGGYPFKGGIYMMDYCGADEYSYLTLHEKVWGRKLVWNLIQRNFVGSDKSQSMHLNVEKF